MAHEFGVHFNLYYWKIRWRVINWVSIALLFFVEYKCLTFCLFFTSPQSMESTTKENKEKQNAWNVIHATNLLFRCTQSCNLVFLNLALDCHESHFNTEVSIFSKGGSLIYISRFILPNEKPAYTSCGCWGSLGLSPHLQAPKAGYEGCLSTSRQLSSPQTWLMQPSSKTSFTVRAAAALCIRTCWSLRWITLAQCYTMSRGAEHLQQGWRRSSWCLQSLPWSFWSGDDSPYSPHQLSPTQLFNSSAITWEGDWERNLRTYTLW